MDNATMPDRAGSRPTATTSSTSRFYSAQMKAAEAHADALALSGELLEALRRGDRSFLDRSDIAGRIEESRDKARSAREQATSAFENIAAT